MKLIIKSNIVAILLFVCSAPIQAFPITRAGEALSSYLDSLNIMHKWQPGVHVDWLSGEPDNKTGVTTSHCSTFAAAAMARMNVYLLRPPQHSEYLLANAQYNWLINESKQQGWFAIENGLKAQEWANQGYAVIVAVKNPNSKRPGHIAVVRPSTKPDDNIINEGPDITQAGLENYQRSSVLQGFIHHIKSAQDSSLIYYGHTSFWIE